MRTKDLQTHENNAGAIVASKEYSQTLQSLDKRISDARLRAALSVNTELIKLYWDIGETIVKKQKAQKWGNSVVECLAKDLQRKHPDRKGFSAPNLFKMKALYLSYENLLQAVIEIENLPIFQIPWGHNILLMSKLEDTNERLWYANKTIENGWSRSTLEMWIKSGLYHREGKAITNFEKTLPPDQCDLIDQTLKNPYSFGFLKVAEEAQEKDMGV